MPSRIDDDATPHGTPPRWVLPTAVVPIVGIIICGYVANAIWASLLTDHPAWLIALSPINRYLLLTTNDLSAPTYYLVGMARHLFPDPFFYLLGYWYGSRALAWAGEVYPAVHRLVGPDGKGLAGHSSNKFLIPLAFFFPSGWAGVVCGASRLPFVQYITANAAGTAARLVIARWLGHAFASEIRSITDFVAKYQMPATIISIILVLVAISTQFKRGSGELVGITHLPEELEGDEHDSEEA